MAARKKKPARKASKRKEKVKRKPRTTRAPRQRRVRQAEAPDLGGPHQIEWTDENAHDVNTMARAGNTVEDMAIILGVGKRSLERETGVEGSPVRVAYYRGIAERRNALRTEQTRRALGGSDRLLIWLGQNDLGQSARKAISVVGGGPDEPSIKFGTDADLGELGPLMVEKVEQYLRSKGKVDPEAPPPVTVPK